MEYHIRISKVISYSEVLDEYGIRMNEDECSIILIECCPWCGAKLPKSKRMEWFEKLEELGFDNPFDCDSIPEEYNSAKWREST
jgi:hypothetical protein